SGVKTMRMSGQNVDPETVDVLKRGVGGERKMLPTDSRTSIRNPGKYSQPLRTQPMFFAMICARFETSTNAVQWATTDAAGGIKGQAPKAKRPHAFRCGEGETARWTQACVGRCS